MLRDGWYMWNLGDPPGEGWELVIHSERDHGLRGYLWFTSGKRHHQDMQSIPPTSEDQTALASENVPLQEHAPPD